MHHPASQDRSPQDALRRAASRPFLVPSLVALAFLCAVTLPRIIRLVTGRGDARNIAANAPDQRDSISGDSRRTDRRTSSPGMVAGVKSVSDAAPDQAFDDDGDREFVSHWLRTHCLECHGSKAPEAGLSLVNLTDIDDLATWKAIDRRLRANEMPPVDALQPTAEERRRALRWVAERWKRAGSSAAVETRPVADGNAVDHRSLFSPRVETSEASTPARLWRVTGPAYEGHIDRLIRRFSLELRNRGDSHLAAPWNFTPQREFADDASVHRVGEAEIEQLLRNATLLAGSMVRRHSGKVPQQGEFIRELATLIQAGDSVTSDQVVGAIGPTFRALLARDPSPDEEERYVSFVQRSAAEQGGRLAAEQLLTALLCQTEVIHRVEIPANSDAAGWLAPHHLARSLAFALTDSLPDEPLARATAEGRLVTRAEVRAQVERILQDPAIRKTRVLRFFREYFGYHLAPGVFKDEATLKKHGLLLRHSWSPEFFVSDADRLVLDVLANDRDVLRELLTTSRTFVMTLPSEQQRNIRTDAYRLKKPKFENDELTVLKVYGIPLEARSGWDPTRAYELPSGQRLGLLTHPAWLISHSGNFDNQVIQRGRWIRERLLGGRIPELPITVNAMLPDEPHRTLRDRMRVTRAEACWKCHRQMDPLGFPFEQFDHLGQYRTAELVAAPPANQRNRQSTPKNKLTDPEFRTVRLDTTGEITGSLDPTLDGPVQDPFELIHRLAESVLVEQVFVRHAFRYFLGRSETLADAPTLVAAHEAYRQGGGSMNALITSLLTSDSFLRRESGRESAAEDSFDNADANPPVVDDPQAAGPAGS